MLILSRKVSEAVALKVGDVEIRVVLVRLAGQKARIGIEAPDCVEILREELAEAEANAAAARSELEAV